MLFNIKALRWDKELYDLLNIPEGGMPQVLPSSRIYVETGDGIFDNSCVPKRRYSDRPVIKKA